jgi:short-subunit dehydrogenase
MQGGGAPTTRPEGPTRRALITGASSGVGAAFARLLSQQGCELVLVGRSRERLESVAGSLVGPTQILVADLTREADLIDVETLVAEATTPVDMLVNNAGAGWYSSFAQLDPHALAETIALNVTAVLRLSRAALPLMVARGHGSLINISSIAGSYPAPNMAVYAASKAFVTNWSASVAAELRGSGVAVTCVNPGYVRTDFHARSGEDLNHIADAEWISPNDVALRALAAHRRGEEVVRVLPEAPLWRRVQRSGRTALVRKAPWLHDVKRALKAPGRSG